jgi:hypothetical protein
MLIHADPGPKHCFKILETVGEPYFGPNLSFKVIISQTFSWDRPVKEFIFELFSQYTKEVGRAVTSLSQDPSNIMERKKSGN